MANVLTWIPGCDPHSPAPMDLFISFDASICSTLAFPPLGNSDHVFVSIFHWLSFGTQNAMSFFIPTAYDDARAD